MCHSALLGHRPTAFSVAAVPGGRCHVVRFTRPSVTAATSRSNWRSEIEAGSSTGSSTGSSSGNAPTGVPGADASAAAPTPATATNLGQSSASATPGSPRSPAPSPSPWSVPGGQTAPAAGADAQAAEGARQEPRSLPTLDLTELLSEPRNQATAFAVLAATSAVLAVLFIVEPDAVLDLMLPQASLSGLDTTFTRVAGVTLAAGGAVEYSLKHAAESQLLRSPTYQRLMAGGAAKSFGYMMLVLLLLLGTETAAAGGGSPALWLWLGCAVVAAGAVGVNLAVLSRTSGSGLTTPPVDLTPPRTAASWGYAACAGLYLLTAGACFAPETLFTGDTPSEVTSLIKALAAPGFLMAGVMSYVLKDAADRGRLGASTFKNLNLGLAALEYGYAVIFGSAILSDQVPLGSPALGNMAGSLLVATFAMYMYATAKK